MDDASHQHHSIVPSTPNLMVSKVRSGSELVNKFSRLSEQVSGALQNGRQHFFQKLFPIPNNLSKKYCHNVTSPTGPFTHVIITSISYRDSTMQLMGPKHDFCLLLKQFKYGEEGNPVQFTLLNDFSAVHKDSAGNLKLIPKTNTSKNAIEKAVKQTMKNVAPGSNVLFYFGGHASGEAGKQSIIAGDGKDVSGSQLQSWLSKETRRSTSVTAVFDACNSGGLFNLPNNYDVTSNGAVEVEKVTRKKKSIPMIQISAAPQGELAYSGAINGGYHGQLTWSFVQYLNTAPDSTIATLVSYLSQSCDPSGAQLPQVSASDECRGRVPFLHVNSNQQVVV